VFVRDQANVPSGSIVLVQQTDLTQVIQLGSRQLVKIDKEGFAFVFRFLLDVCRLSIYEMLAQQGLFIALVSPDAPHDFNVCIAWLRTGIAWTDSIDYLLPCGNDKNK